MWDGMGGGQRGREGGGREEGGGGGGEVCLWRREGGAELSEGGACLLAWLRGGERGGEGRPGEKLRQVMGRRERRVT